MPPIESEDDRASFLIDDGELVTIDGVEVSALFTAAHVPIDMGGHIIESAEPLIIAPSSDLTSVTEGSVIRRGSKNYGVLGIEPDGFDGMTTLRLREL